jgi:hypothetical protein
MSDSADTSGSGSGSGSDAAHGTAEVKKTNEVSLSIDPKKLEEVVTGHVADKNAADGSKSHAVQLSLDNATFADFKTSVGDINLMKSANVSLDPDATKGTDLGAHVELLNIHWNDIGPVALNSIVSDDFKLTDGKPSDAIKFEQDATLYKNISLTGSVTTTIDGSGAKAQFEGGIKFTW